MSNDQLGEIPEFMHHDTETRRRELVAAGTAAPQHLEKIKQRLNIPNLTGVKVNTQPVAEIADCIPQVRVLNLQVGLKQRMQKQVLEQWNLGGQCYRVVYTLDFQFTGYGSYCLSFEKDPGNTNLFNNFFRDIAAYGINFHRTILFVNENLENSNMANLHRLLQDGDPHKVMPNTNYLANLYKMVTAAKAYGIVIQVCLFMHHSVAHDGATTPLPIVLSGNAHTCYQTFYSTTSDFQPMQQNLIDGVVNQLITQWNVVYEIGNELRVPDPTTVYGEPELKAWIDWAATRIRNHDPSHLITTSTGVGNESGINSLPRVQFCSFHQGQWKANLDNATDRANNNYGQKHLVIDDDGGRRNIADVKTWAKAALGSRDGCRCSFNHKGSAPINRYSADWITQTPMQYESKPIDALQAMRDARTTSGSPCAKN